MKKMMLSLLTGVNNCTQYNPYKYKKIGKIRKGQQRCLKV